MALLLLLGGGLWWRSRRPEPVVEGRRLGDFVIDLAVPGTPAADRARPQILALGTNAIPWLLAALQDRDPFYLGMFVDWSPRLPLSFRIWFLSSFRPFEAEHRRKGAIRALALFGTNVPPASLIDALGDPVVGQEVVTTLGGMGVAAVPELRRALQHSDPVIRIMACSALRYTNVPELALPELLGLLGDSSSNVVAAASSMVAYCGRPAVRQVLAIARRPGDPRREGALRTLMLMGPVAREALPYLRELAGGEDEVSALAAGAVRAIESPPPGP